jgi:hypothetical protein
VRRYSHCTTPSSAVCPAEAAHTHDIRAAAPGTLYSIPMHPLEHATGWCSGSARPRWGRAARVVGPTLQPLHLRTVLRRQTLTSCCTCCLGQADAAHGGPRVGRTVLREQNAPSGIRKW